MRVSIGSIYEWAQRMTEMFENWIVVIVLKLLITERYT